MKVIGDLFDEELAKDILTELEKRGFQVALEKRQANERMLFVLLCEGELEELEKAHQYFRVRVGLPAPPPEIDPEWIKLKSVSMGVVTKALIVLCAGVYLFTFNEQSRENIFNALFFDLNVLKPWLLITPILLHFNFFHILFNLMWLKDLGSAYEVEKGSQSFVAFILITAAFSNYSQYVLMGNHFGGMSGVVYALLGHMWVYSKTHEEAQFSLPKKDIYLMIGWYFLCLSGLIGNIANMAHGVGLALGMLAGFFPLKNYKRSHWKYVAYSAFFIVGTYYIETLKG